MKLIDLLVMAENKELKDDQRVIIDDQLYYWNEKDKRFYTTPSKKCQDMYRTISTDRLDYECEILQNK